MKRFAGIVLALLMLPGLGLGEGSADHTELFLAYLTSYGGAGTRASDALRASVVLVGESRVADDIRLTVTGAVFDGRFFAVGWLVENLRPGDPAQVLCKKVEVNGRQVFALADFPWTTWSPRFTGLDLPGAERQRLSFGMSGELEDMEAAGELTVRVSFAVKRPKGELVVVDPLVYEYASLEEGMRADWAHMLEALRASGVRIAGPGELDPDAWAAQGYTVLDAGGQYYLDGAYYSEYELSDMSALHNIQYEGPAEETMETVEEAVVEFTMDPGACLSRVLDVTPREDIVLEDRYIRFAQVRLSPLTTYIEYEAIPLEATEEMWQRLAYGAEWPALTDAGGAPLAFSGAGAVVNHGGSGMREHTDGSFSRATRDVRPGLMEVPAGLRLTVSDVEIPLAIPR